MGNDRAVRGRPLAGKRPTAKARIYSYVLKGENRIPGVDLDPLEARSKQEVYTIVKTYIDGSVTAKAMENAKQALEDFPDLKSMVGLYGYNGPMCLKALKEAEQLGNVKVVAFDEHKETLDAIEAGHVYATVVQDPFQYGYEAVRILTALASDKPHSIPYAGSGVLYLKSMTVKQDNLAKFPRAGLKNAGPVSRNDRCMKKQLRGKRRY